MCHKCGLPIGRWPKNAIAAALSTKPRSTARTINIVRGPVGLLGGTAAAMMRVFDVSQVPCARDRSWLAVERSSADQ